VAGERLFAVDFETFGLNLIDDPVIEIGCKILDLDFVVIDEFHAVVWDEPYTSIRFQEEREANTWVYDHHLKSGLWDEAFKNGIPSGVAAERFKSFLDGHGTHPEEDHLVGSSVHFDYYMMHFNFPDSQELFHHRLLDITALKVATDTFFPGLARRRHDELKPKKLHRVMPDIDDSIAELAWYLENLLPEEDE
jgi:oligoribonuclease